MLSNEMRVACVGIQVVNLHIPYALKLSYKLKVLGLFFLKEYSSEMRGTNGISFYAFHVYQQWYFHF